MTPEIVQTIASAVEPWKDAYADSRVISIAVLFGHLGALLLGGGVAITTDLASVRASRASSEVRHEQVEALHRAHRVVVAGLVVLAGTGLLLAASDVETFAVSFWFWIKIALVVLLLVNGAVLYRTGSLLRRRAEAQHEERHWRRLRIVSTLSFVLWVATVLAGTILQGAA
jgi:uncharacterized membrane protein